jgi:hypothetical protein
MMVAPMACGNVAVAIVLSDGERDEVGTNVQNEATETRPFAIKMV